MAGYVMFFCPNDEWPYGVAITESTADVDEAMRFARDNAIRTVTGDLATVSQLIQSFKLTYPHRFPSG